MEKKKIPKNKVNGLSDQKIKLMKEIGKALGI
jgi:hypothetical protein